LSEYLDDKIERIQNLVISVGKLEGKTVQDLPKPSGGLEGTAGRLYFETINYVLPQPYQFNGRSSRPAKDSFNAFLNYAYGILYTRIEKALILAGLDPYVGYLHRDDYNQKSMVFDFIEPFRIFVEVPVFRLFTAKKVNKAHIDEITNGVTLNKEGKELLIKALNDYLEEDSIRYKNRNQTRANIIQQEAHTYANQLIEKTKDTSETMYL